jgi:hypothetical protein
MDSTPDLVMSRETPIVPEMIPSGLRSGILVVEAQLTGPVDSEHRRRRHQGGGGGSQSGSDFPISSQAVSCFHHGEDPHCGPQASSIAD